MTRLTAVFLPAQGGGPARWLHLDEARVVARGDGWPDVAATDRVVAIAPAAAVRLQWATLPGRSPAQALAAARLIAAEASVAPSGHLHVAIGGEPDEVLRPVAIVDMATMRRWVADLAAAGVEPAAMVPAPLLLAAPAEGLVRADLGGEVVVRGATLGFVDEPALTVALAEGVDVPWLDRPALEAGVARALADPPLDLLQGAFARRRRLAMPDWATLRPLVLLAVAVALATLALGMVHAARDNAAAAPLEARNDALLRAATGADGAEGDRRLTDRLRALGGPGLGFTRTAGALFAAVRGAAGSEIVALDFDEKGSLRAAIVADNREAIGDVQAQLTAMGLRARLAGAPVADGTRLRGELLVAPR